MCGQSPGTGCCQLGWTQPVQPNLSRRLLGRSARLHEALLTSAMKLRRSCLLDWACRIHCELWRTCLPDASTRAAAGSAICSLQGCISGGQWFTKASFRQIALDERRSPARFAAKASRAITPSENNTLIPAKLRKLTPRLRHLGCQVHGARRPLLQFSPRSF